VFQKEQFKNAKLIGGGDEPMGSILVGKSFVVPPPMLPENKWRSCCKPSASPCGEEASYVKITRSNVDRVLQHPFEAFSCIASV
jgi:hypothetical protein